MSYEIKTLFHTDCTKCNRRFHLEAFESDFDAWQGGKLIQNAFPYLDANERELIKSHICGDCFDAMFKDF